jgi:hypothetical protein
VPVYFIVNEKLMFIHNESKLLKDKVIHVINLEAQIF